MPSYYSKIYVVGLKSESEFWGNRAPPKLFLFQGEGGRQWLEAHYPTGEHSKKMQRGLVPEDSTYALLDACMSFLPEVFEEITSFDDLKKALRSKEFIDLNLEKPKPWDRLREECLKYMGRLEIKTFDINKGTDRRE